MYYIYHIPGSKIGCTTDIKRRARQGNYTSYEILESHTCVQTASDRERELQIEYGYSVDKTPYTHVIENFATRVKSPEELEALSNRWPSIRNKFNDNTSKVAGSIGGTKQSQVERTCPHCGKVGRSNAMFGHHFDRCKNKNQ